MGDEIVHGSLQVVDGFEVVLGVLAVVGGEERRDVSTACRTKQGLALGATGACRTKF